jgi:hypothetical protein
MCCIALHFLYMLCTRSDIAVTLHRPLFIDRSSVARLVIIVSFDLDHLLKLRQFFAHQLLNTDAQRLA